MSREIKFRAWAHNEMSYEGFHISAPGIVWVWKNHQYNDSESLEGEVMQYTGLKDMNGVEIYESDVVKCNGFFEDAPILKNGEYVVESFSDHVGVVVFDAYGISVDGEDEMSVPLGCLYDCSECEVIGNIYEHPHLLTPQPTNP